jgi:hypothetical protein
MRLLVFCITVLSTCVSLPVIGGENAPPDHDPQFRNRLCAFISGSLTETNTRFSRGSVTADATPSFGAVFTTDISIGKHNAVYLMAGLDYLLFHEIGAWSYGSLSGTVDDKHDVTASSLGIGVRTYFGGSPGANPVSVGLQAGGLWSSSDTYSIRIEGFTWGTVLTVEPHAWSRLGLHAAIRSIPVQNQDDLILASVGMGWRF